MGDARALGTHDTSHTQFLTFSLFYQMKFFVTKVPPFSVLDEDVEVSVKQMDSFRREIHSL